MQNTLARLAAEFSQHPEFPLCGLGWIDLVTDDVRYDLFIAREKPYSCTLHGCNALQKYLSILPNTYDIQQVKWRRHFAKEDSLIAMGAECARLVRLDQRVDAEWIAEFGIRNDRIAHIAMYLHKWEISSC